MKIADEESLYVNESLFWKHSSFPSWKWSSALDTSVLSFSSLVQLVDSCLQFRIKGLDTVSSDHDPKCFVTTLQIHFY